jgi:hypothetical protein
MHEFLHKVSPQDEFSAMQSIAALAFVENEKAAEQSA